MALAEPKATVPPAIVIPPLLLLGPLSRSVPEPSFVSAPEPERLPEAVSVLFPPTLMVLLAFRLKVRSVENVPLASSVPPLRMTELILGPSWPAVVTSSVPSEMRIAPVILLLLLFMPGPCSSSVPRPTFSSWPLPVRFPAAKK